MNSKQQKALELILEGKSIKAICNELNISRRTLERWRQLPEFAEVDAEIREVNRANARKRIESLMPRVIDELEEIAMSGGGGANAKLRALTALGTWGGLGEKPEPEPRRLEIPDREFTEDEVRDSFYQFKDNLERLAVGQIIEGAKAKDLAKITEVIDNLNAIMLEMDRFYNLTLKERMFDKNIKTYVQVGIFGENVLPFERMKKIADLDAQIDAMAENWEKTDEERGITPEMRRQAEAHYDEMMRRQHGDDWESEDA